MLIKKFIIGSLCILFIVGVFNKVVYCDEEKEPFITLIEKQKVYLITPKKTFQYYCGPCHGDSANGKGIYFTIDLKPKPRDLTDIEYMAELTDDYLLNFISKGSAAMEKSNLCPPWGGTFDKDRIKGIIAYLRNLTIAKSKVEEKPAEKEGEEVKVAVGEKKGAPQAVIWSVLIILCSLFAFAAIYEWKKLSMEETSK